MGMGIVGSPLLTGDQVANELAKIEISHAVYVADVMCAFIIDELKNRPEFTMVPVCREGEAVPVATGLWMAGKRPIVLHQNSGFFESGDSVIQVGMDLRVPLLLLLGYRGFRYNSADVTDPPAIYIEPVLKALDLPYEVIETPERITKLSALQQEAENMRKPAVALIAWELAC